MPYTTDLKTFRAPLKEKYRSDPSSAVSSAERYCSTLQTLRHGIEVATDFSLS